MTRLEKLILALALGILALLAFFEFTKCHHATPVVGVLRVVCVSEVRP